MIRPRHTRIAGVGSYLPADCVSNDELVRRGIDTSDEWIRTRSGIASRHFAAPGETTSAMALAASRHALDAAGRKADEIDLIIVATSTPDVVFPSTACLLQAQLQNCGATAFDVQAVCSGFIYALGIADKFIRSGSHRLALVVGAETFSNLLDWKDRTTCVLFGDGAGAVLLEASDEAGRGGILATALHADGSQSGLLGAPGQVRGGQVCGDPFVRMDGPAVFKFAVQVLSGVAQEVCDLAGVAPGEVDWLVPHQANIRIIEATANKFGIAMDKVVATVAHHGNTSAASVPLALDEAIRDGRIRRGQKVLLEGVGGGFTWGAALLEY